ncbi:zinc finger MYM-type protein 1-like isoform X2 [Arctopsyche grandis]
MLDDGDYFDDNPSLPLNSDCVDMKSELLTTESTCVNNLKPIIEIKVPAIGGGNEENNSSRILEIEESIKNNNKKQKKNPSIPATVTEIKSVKFSRLSHAEKIKIKQRGRPTPPILLSQAGVSKNKTYNRNFNTEWYEKKKWLCGCEVTNTLFCFPCLLFSSNQVWAKSGYSSLSRIKINTEEHECSRKHIDSVIRLQLLDNINIKNTFSKAYKLSIVKYNERVEKNRQILSKVIDFIKFCSNFKMSLHAHRSNEEYENPFIFDVMAILNSDLKDLLTNNPAFEGSTTNIQNELLDCMLQVCQDYIASQVNETSYVAVMLDDTADVLEPTQAVIVLRYELNSEVHERFWGLFAPENQKPDSLSDCILDQLDILLKNDESKLIAQTFDGIMNGKKDYVQSMIKEKYQNANFIHCYTNKLDLMMKNAASSSVNSRIFFANISEMSAFFTKSPLRLSVLNKYMNYCEQIASTKMNFHMQTVNSVHVNRVKLIQYFEELISTSYTTDKTIRDSSLLLKTLNDENFLFWLEFYHKIIPCLTIVHNEMTPSDKIKYLEMFDSAIIQIRKLYCVSSSPEMIEAREICDYISKDIKQRYSRSRLLIASQLLEKNIMAQHQYHKTIPAEEVILVTESYPMLDNKRLLMELEVLYKRKEIHTYDGLHHLLSIMTEHNLTNVLYEITKLIKIIITVPTMITEPDLCFTSLRRIKKFLSTVNGRDRLSALTMISVEKNMIDRIPYFNEKVINLFSQNQHRKQDFVLK